MVARPRPAPPAFLPFPRDPAAGRGTDITLTIGVDVYGAPTLVSAAPAPSAAVVAAAAAEEVIAGPRPSRVPWSPAIRDASRYPAGINTGACAFPGRGTPCCTACAPTDANASPPNGVLAGVRVVRGSLEQKADIEALVKETRAALDGVLAEVTRARTRRGNDR